MVPLDLAWINSAVLWRYVCFFFPFFLFLFFRVEDRKRMIILRNKCEELSFQMRGSFLAESLSFSKNFDRFDVR